jgi:predicted  nucleic acid-binding Zn-ribbon protein
MRYLFLYHQVEKLNKTCREQQQVIHQTISKGPANQTEACLQHEITRLTGENFDLREKIENLNETIKRLKRQLKSYMKKLHEVGGNVSCHP